MSRAKVEEAAGRSRKGVTMIELLCVMAIIAILASLLLPAVLRAYQRVKGMVDEWEEPEVAPLLIQETRAYCASNPQFSFASKTDLTSKCQVASKCYAYVQATTTSFVPFNYQTPTNQVVLTFYLGPNGRSVYNFTCGQLSITPQPQ